jgi:hypothetical protein
MPDSLFYEYAIIPDVFHADYIGSDARLEIILPTLLKGIIDNGMIANLNKDGWLEFIKNDRLPTIMSPIFKDKIMQYLSVLHDRHRLVRHPKSTHGSPTTDLEWLNLALESHEQIKFHGIIASWSLLSKCDETCGELIDVLNVLDSAQWNGMRRTLTLPACEAYYRPVLDPILRHAKSLIIVDPYISPYVKKYKDFLKICIEQMGRRGASTLSGRIQIHTGDPSEDRYRTETVNDRLKAWDTCIRDLFSTPIPHKIKVFIRKKRDAGRGNRFHDRFILTDQCCISIPMGVDTYGEETPNNTTWTLLDHEDMQKKAEEIDPEMKFYETLGESIIIAD